MARKGRWVRREVWRFRVNKCRRLPRKQSVHLSDTDYHLTQFVLSGLPVGPCILDRVLTLLPYRTLLYRRGKMFRSFLRAAGIAWMKLVGA